MKFFLLMALLLLCTFQQFVFAEMPAHELHHKKTTIMKKKYIKKRIVRNHQVNIPNAIPLYTDKSLAHKFNQLLANENADISVFIKSMRRGDVLYARNIFKPLIPASTLKAVTALSALIYLGPDYRFSTQLLTDADEVKNGVLQGNLYIILSGDPALTYHHLIDLLLALKSQQINAIAGNVYIDNTAFDKNFYGPGWKEQDKKHCFAAPISASIINHNCLALKVAPSHKQGRAAEIKTYAKYFYPTIRNGVVTRAKTRNCNVRFTEDVKNYITLEGCMGVGRYAWGVNYVITDVPEYTRSLFKNLLRRLHVSVYGRITFKSAPAQLALISQHGSPPLKILINEMMKKSDNVIAGAIFKKMGQLYNNRPGSWTNSGMAVKNILNRHAHVDTSGLRILDGSGLSPQNQISAAQMMQILNFAYHHKTNNEFISSLPISGIDGTLKNRMGHITRKVRAKTGTISGVVGLAGYAVSADQEPYAFVILVNGSKQQGWHYKSLEDQIVTLITHYRR